jgi:acetaldehyde dehydrogenase/alcohol dehydrogenase
MSKVEEIIERACRAAEAFRALDQQRTDAAVRAAARAALAQRVALARMAHEETGIGRWQHKVVKNAIAGALVYESIRNLKTVGVIAEDPGTGIVEAAQPLGPVLGLIPVTNPTSTVIFKCLIALKTRNPLIVCPHQGARRCAAAAAEACYRAALEAGAPRDCIQWLEKAGPETLQELMGHDRLALILATGTGSIVRKAHSSGTPVIGVGPGNVPACIDAGADVRAAVGAVIESKTFDHGSVCASEQALVVERRVAERVVEELRRRGARFLTAEEAERVGRIAYDRDRGSMSAAVVGQAPQRIAEMAGIAVAPATTLLVAVLERVGPDCPLSAEILAPILAFYAEADFESAVRRCTEIVRFGGAGHTAVIHSRSEDHIEYFARALDVGRILVNTPATQGALGGIYNMLSPSFTLGCGAGGRNISMDNIGARHLLNIKRIARPRPNPRWASLREEALLDDRAPLGLLES